MWGLVSLCVLAQVAYPLVAGSARDALTVVTVVLCFAAAAGHAALTRGVRVAALLVAVTAGGGLLVEAAGTATGFPFGAYDYAGSLGPRVLGVPLVIPLAWTMMAWPAWLVAGRLVGGGGLARVVLAGWALASWDLFLDPQMVDAGHWAWRHPDPALPGVASVPLTNYAGWVVVAVAMMAVFQAAAGSRGGTPGSNRMGDGPMFAFYLWTYFSSVLAHLAFFGLPASALWGGLAMGTVALPLAAVLASARRGGGAHPGAVAR
jgi:putative membrane protein